MKKTILLLFFAIFSLFLQAQQPFFVGGYVKDSNGMAIPNHIVYIIADSSNSGFNYSSYTYTNSNGFYSSPSFTFPTGALINFHISTSDCLGAFHTTTITNANSQNMVNFTICNTTASNCQAIFLHTASIASNFTFSFNDISTGSPVSWLWNFGDGTTSNQQNPVHSFNSYGPFYVCLTITTASNCTSTYCDTIVIQGNPTNTCNANFQFYPDSLAGLNTIHFLNSSNTTYLNYPISYSWNFGDGTTSTQQNPTHTFQLNASGTGVYNVCLTMNVLASNNTILCSNTICQTITIGTSTNNCQNSFTYTNQNLAYSFVGSINSTNPTTYSWNFGDGSTANGQYVNHIFALPPSGSSGYYVILTTYTVNNNTGTTCMDTSMQFIPVNINPNTCNANFSYHPDSLTGLNIIHFYNTSTTTFTNYQILYSWNFGDGTTSTVQHPVHNYIINPSTPIIYNACLTMSILNSSGTVLCQSNFCQNISIGTSGNGCQNSFTYTNQNLTYSFAGQINATNPTTTYTWNFGDGTSATGQNVTHTFAQPPSGSNGYHVCLTTVTMNNGIACTSNSCQNITIGTSGGNIIQGHVYAGNYPVNNGYVLLYQANNATLSYVLTDTLSLDSSGYYFYNYLNVPPVTPAFLLKAVLNSSAANYNLFVPTFYLHTINWFSATAVFPSANTVFYNINMIPLSVNPISGNGSLGGNVSQLGTKSSGNSPLSGIELILTDENDNPLKITYSDLNGNFNFKNLAMGTYKLHVEIAGINYTPYPVVLNSNNTNINNIIISITNNGAIITGIENGFIPTSSISDIYPNPATSEAFIEIKNSKSENINISIYNNTGIRVSSTDYMIDGNQIINLNDKLLPAGIYAVKISKSNGYNNIRKLVISK